LCGLQKYRRFNGFNQYLFSTHTLKRIGRLPKPFNEPGPIKIRFRPPD
jgi:hypothetical protein